MATVHFSPEAQNDLEQIKNYIQNDLENDLGDGIPRYFDTEAKFLEFVADKKKPEDSFSVTILSEKHICKSCQGVVQQFKEQFPNAKVNIVSGKKGYNNSEEGLKTWKHRKKVK
ncbi:MAG: deaminase domain-containing protein [Ruminococcus sp.]|nr:deaminase domain-containing protein [Ruminococcus sp.]